MDGQSSGSKEIDDAECRKKTTVRLKKKKKKKSQQRVTR